MTARIAHKPPRRSTLLWQRLVLIALTGAAAWVQRMSRPRVLRFGAKLGDLAFRVAGRQRRRAEQNLRLAYGSALTSPERTAIIHGVFRHFAALLLDFMRGPSLTPDMVNCLVTVEGWENVEAAQAGGRGVLMITGHLGNWEIMGRWLALRLPLTVVAKEPKNLALAAYMRRMREDGGFAVLNKGESARDLLRVLKGNGAVLILPDQNSGDVFVPFFGVPAGTVAGPASLARHTGAPIVPVFCLALSDGTFHLRCLPALAAELSDNRDADTVRIMTLVNATIEGEIRAHPDQWLWLHNRWKAAFDTKNHDRAWPTETGYDAAYKVWRG